jgi:hypothetical protein
MSENPELGCCPVQPYCGEALNNRKISPINRTTCTHCTPKTSVLTPRHLSIYYIPLSTRLGKISLSLGVPFGFRLCGQCALWHEVVNTMYLLEFKTKCVRLPVNGTMPLTAVQTPTATHSSAPLGTLEAHPVCSIPGSTHSTQQRTPTRGTDSVSRPLLAWSMEYQTYCALPARLLYT